MNWINKDNSYFLEYDNTLLISVDTDGNYYLFNNKENKKYLVGVQGDSENVIKSNAEELMKQYNLVVKNASVMLLAELINTIKSEGSEKSSVYKKLVNCRFLPPTIIPQYVTRYINPEDLIKSMGENTDSSMKVLDLYNDIISIDPTTQSVATATTTNNGRNIAIEEATDFIAKGNKQSLIITQGEKIFESVDEFLSSEEIPLKGFSIKLGDLYSTISVVFLGSSIYIIIVDEINNVDEMFKYDDEIRQYVLDFYNIDLNSYLNTEPINEDFGDGNNDGNNDGNTPPQSPPKPNTIDKPNDNNQDNKFNFDDIVAEHDEEYVQELEIIQRNIEKIESLPDDIRYNNDIEEVYLLLLGKKEQIQKMSDEEKSNKIIDKVVDEISTELGNIEGLSNIKKESDDNELENSLSVNEGKVIKFRNKLIKPVFTNKFGVFEKSLVINKKVYKINESSDIRKVLETINESLSWEDNRFVQTVFDNGYDTVEVSLKYASEVQNMWKDNKYWGKVSQATSTNTYTFKEEDDLSSFLEELITNGIPASELELN